MKRVIKLSALAVLIYILAIKSGALSNLVLFFLIGLVPGTNYSLSPLSTLLALLVCVFGIYGSLKPSLVQNLLENFGWFSKPKRQLPRRRYSSIETN